VNETQNSENFMHRLQGCATLIDARLDAWLANSERHGFVPERLAGAMRHAVLGGGKRFRPFLLIETARLCGLADEAALNAAAALECIHCYSLAHDDLPAMDDDDIRRGRPTVHKAFDEATAILAGDGLLTLAFEWIAEAGEAAGRPGPYLAAARALARGAGVRGMVRGQARDLGEAPPADVAGLECLHAEKTGALFRASIEIGAAVSGARDGERAALVAFGERFGVAFQHADDLADADHAEHAAAARARLETLVDEAVTSLAPLGARGERLAGLARRLLLGSGP